MNQQYTAMMDVMAASIKLAITEAIQQSMAISGQREQLDTNVRQGTRRLSTLASPSNDKIVYMRSDQKDFEFKMSAVREGNASDMIQLVKIQQLLSEYASNNHLSSYNWSIAFTPSAKDSIVAYIHTNNAVRMRLRIYDTTPSFADGVKAIDQL